ncbi:MAG TPA: nuclear transport factor 2 family protein [Intrasporangiaceae bacterium]|nr:nuclear transport factor 2 family protein [Intrasporangiaceae bacterium]
MNAVPGSAAKLDLDRLPPHVRAWVTADRNQDLTVMKEQLSPSVVLISPLTDAFTFDGPDEVMAVFESAFELLSDIEIAGVTCADQDWVIYGTNTIGGENLEEIQWLRLDDAGRIERITLFIRPAPAAITLLSRIGPRLKKRGVMGGAAAFASGAARPLALALRVTEGRVMPRLR